MTAVRPVRVRPPVTRTLSKGPFQGMLDAPQPVASQPTMAANLINLLPRDTEFGGLVVGRPGFVVMGDQLGTGSDRRIQWIGEYAKRDGTTKTLAIVGGQVFLYNWALDSWSTVVTTANLTAQTVTLSATATLGVVTFADKLIVSDGVNTPFAWDGTANGGITKLSACPALYGQPVVYYGKLFGIKASARQTVVWSEEGEPNIGFESGGYNNAWDLIQTSSDRLEALAATNEALYYFRRDSTGAVTGAVTTDFQTTGTRESVAEGTGTLSPFGISTSPFGVVFMDQQGAIRVARLGGGTPEIGIGHRQFLRTVPTANLADVLALYDEVFDTIRFAVPALGQDDPSVTLLLDARDGRALARHEGYTFTAFGLVRDADGAQRFAHGGGSTATTVNGYAYVHGTYLGTSWDDAFVAGSEPISHQIDTGTFGWDDQMDQAWDRLDLTFLTQTTLSNCGIQSKTPRAVGETLSFSVAGSGGGTVGSAVVGTAVTAGASNERHVHVGLRSVGRWLKTRLSHATLGEQFALETIRASAAPLDRRPVKE